MAQHTKIHFVAKISPATGSWELLPPLEGSYMITEARGFKPLSTEYMPVCRVLSRVSQVLAISQLVLVASLSSGSHLCLLEEPTDRLSWLPGTNSQF